MIQINITQYINFLKELVALSFTSYLASLYDDSWVEFSSKCPSVAFGAAKMLNTLCKQNEIELVTMFQKKKFCVRSL